MVTKKYFIKVPKGKEQTMNQLNWSRIIGVLSLIVTVGTMVSTYLGNLLPHDVAIVIVGVTAAISAFVERVQGGASKL